MTFLRYIVIQLLAYVIDLGGFLLVLKSGIVGPIVANILSKLAAGIFAFIAHRNFTFYANNSGDRVHQAVRYFILLALNVPLSSGVLALMLSWLEAPSSAKIVADVICVVLTYWLSKSFVFIKKSDVASGRIASERADT